MVHVIVPVPVMDPAAICAASDFGIVHETLVLCVLPETMFPEALPNEYVRVW